MSAICEFVANPVGNEKRSGGNSLGYDLLYCTLGTHETGVSNPIAVMPDSENRSGNRGARSDGSRIRNADLQFPAVQDDRVAFTGFLADDLRTVRPLVRRSAEVEMVRAARFQIAEEVDHGEFQDAPNEFFPGKLKRDRGVLVLIPERQL